MNGEWLGAARTIGAVQSYAVSVGVSPSLHVVKKRLYGIS
jgi:hypothetical protein